jgi:DNA polymerase-1
LESYVVDSHTASNDKDFLAEKYLSRKTITYESIAGSGSKEVTFNKVNIDKAAAYLAEKTEIIFDLHEFFYTKLLTSAPLLSDFEKIEMPLIYVLASMERKGVLIDREKLLEQSKAIASTLSKLQLRAFELAGGEFNLNSPKQLQEILYSKMRLPILKKTPTGQPSTAEFVLEELALDHPFAQIILDYRSLSKLKSTYTDTLPEQVNESTGRVHTSYHQASVATGRLSSSNPNLQNIPIKTEEGRKIRKAFIAPPEFLILSADYSQIELRIMAHLSQDKNLISAFENSIDVHSVTASEVFGVSLPSVTQEQRRSAKAINFGLIYGMSAFGLSQQLSIDRVAAQLYIDKYFSRFNGVKQYMENSCERAHELGYVETLYGRRLYLPEIHSKNIQRQRAAERAAVNAPLQGTAADIIKMAMVKMNQWLAHSTIEASMIMQVHDELVFEVSVQSISMLKTNVSRIMENAAALDVPLCVQIGVGSNWDEAH